MGPTQGACLLNSECIPGKYCKAKGITHSHLGQNIIIEDNTNQGFYQLKWVYSGIAKKCN